MRVGGVALALALIAGGSAAGEELWRAAEREEPCRIVLINELGGVHVSPVGEQAVVSSQAPGLAIEAVTSGLEVVLTVVDRGDLATGDVELRVPRDCDVRVRTGDGAVDVQLGPEPIPIAVDTVTGAITVWADPDAAATIRLATSGEITTDFTVTIEFRYHQEPAKHGRVVIAGGGSTEIRLRSRRGATRVLRPRSSLSKSGT